MSATTDTTAQSRLTLDRLEGHLWGAADIRRGDTLRDRKRLVPDGRGLGTFDRVVANPPFSLANRGHELWCKGDGWGFDRWGCSAKSCGDLAFVQNLTASLAADGMLGIVLAHTILFRGGRQETFRQGMLTDDIVELVIGLVPNPFYSTGIPACILVVNRVKPPHRKERTRFVHRDEEFVEGKNQNTPAGDNVTQLSGAFHRFVDGNRFSCVVPLEGIVQNNYNVSIPRYVDSTGPVTPLDVVPNVAKLIELWFALNTICVSLFAPHRYR